MTGALILSTEADLSPGYGANNLSDVEYAFEGGASKGVNLARRLRRVSPDRARRLRVIQNRIIKLQREHVEAILATWGDGIELDVADLAAIAKRYPKKYGDVDPRGASKRTVGQAMSPRFEAFPRELVAQATRSGMGGCSLHGFGPADAGCPGCAR